MGILLPSTVISVLRKIDEDDEELRAAYTGSPEDSTHVVAAGIPAHIGSGGGSERVSGDRQQENLSFSLFCDPCDIDHEDIVLDEGTGKKYQVQWVVHRKGIGMDYMAGGLRYDEGSEYFNG